MRRIIIRLTVALCTFVLGFGAASLWLPAARDTQEAPCPLSPPATDIVAVATSADLQGTVGLPILAYCELVNNPDRYSRRVVRVHATLRGFIHGLLFYEHVCPVQTAVAFPTNEEGVRSALAEAAGSPYFGHEPLDLIVVGRFEKIIPSNESDALWETAPLRFYILRVEKATKAR